MTIQQMFLGTGAAGDSFFIATLNTSQDERGNGIAVGSDGSIYVCGGGSGDVYKYDSNGVLQWQRYFDIGSNWNAIAIDSNDNVYVVQRYNQDRSVLVKYNSSGVYQWNKTLDPYYSGHYFQPQDVDVDGSDNIYVAGNVLDLSGNTIYRAFVVKYDTSANQTWQMELAMGSTNSMDCYGCSADSSGNVYITGGANQQSGFYNAPYAAKISSNGTPQWMTYFNAGSNSAIGYAVNTDSSGNVYIGGHANQNTGNGSDAFLAKFNSSGTNQWQNFSGYSQNTDELQGVAIDSSGNVISVGLINQYSGGYPTAVIYKHNSSGTLQFVRTLQNSNSAYSGVYTYITAVDVTLDSNDNIYITGMTNKSTQDTSNPSDEIVIAKLPGDGSLTGTYGSFTYADASSYAHSNNTTSTFSVSSGTLTDLSSSYSPNSGTLTGRTEAATNLTSVTTPVQ